MQVDYLRARVYCSGLTAVGTLSSPNVFVLHSDHHSLNFLHQTHMNRTLDGFWFSKSLPS